MSHKKMVQVVTHRFQQYQGVGHSSGFETINPPPTALQVIWRDNWLGWALRLIQIEFLLQQQSLDQRICHHSLVAWQDNASEIKSYSRRLQCYVVEDLDDLQTDNRILALNGASEFWRLCNLNCSFFSCIYPRKKNNSPDVEICLVERYCLYSFS